MTPLQGFSPDMDPCSQGIMTACSNIVPFEAGFKGAPSAVDAYVDALAAACIGAVVATKLDGTRRTFAGTATKLYELSGATWTDRTRAVGGDYASASDARWSFCQFGDTTLAANLADTIQSTSSGAFANISGAPKAKVIVSASNNFVIAFNTVDGTYGTSQDRWWCCAQSDQTSWTPDVTTSATTGRLVAVEGPIQAGLPLGDNVIAYKNRAIFLGSFVGSPVVWQWALVPGGESFGVVGQEAVCDIGGAHFGISDDGPWIFDGTRPVPVGSGVIRRWFVNNSSPFYRARTKVIYDKPNKHVRIYFPSSASSGTCDSCLVFHLETKQWGVADASIEAPLTYIFPGVTIDGLDTYAATINALPDIPLEFFQAGGQVCSYFDTTHLLVNLSGPCATSSITTSDMGDDDSVSLMDRFRVRFTLAPTTATATGFTKMNAGDETTIVTTATIDDGKFDLLQSARWHRVRVDMTGDHKETGYAPDLVKEGMR